MKKFMEELRVLLILIIIAFTIKSTLLEIYVVPTGSMENTILTGDLLLSQIWNIQYTSLRKQVKFVAT